MLPFLRWHLTVLVICMEMLPSAGLCSGQPIALPAAEARRPSDGRPAPIKMDGIHIIDFLYACKEGCLSSKTPALRYIRDINVRDEKGSTGLLLAAENGHLEAVKTLLTIPSINVECLDEHGFTPLQRAAQYRYLDIVQVLLEHGHANIDNQGGSWQRTALHLAAEAGNLAATSYLLSKGANFNLTDKAQWTPLLIALAIYHLKKNKNIAEISAVAHCLIKAGTDLAIKDNEGKTALHHAVLGELETVVIALVTKNPGLTDIIDNKGKKPIEYARRESIRLLLP